MLRSVNWVRWTSKAVDYIKKPSSQKSSSQHQTKSNTRSLSNRSIHESQQLLNRRNQKSKQLDLTSVITISRGMSEARAAPRHTNRLIDAKSPYLLQHAHNPVDWYPWGDEAIEKAQRENKPIFLSIGYSTCHWCHVMEKESFENEEIAAIMNDNFVNIKVDREERPDVDKVYMQFVLMLNGSGGWPMSIWLTPDLTPITGGTYFPPRDRYGVPSFRSVLELISQKWTANPAKLKATGVTVIEEIQKSLCTRAPQDEFEGESVDAKLLEAIKLYAYRFDNEHGGFGKQPKFPEVSRLNFLFHAYVITKDSDILDMVLMTLKEIGKGGIHDHVFGGFARYAVDRNWHVPHFEKMLYDQGQLMAAYANAYKLTGDEEFYKYADGIFEYITKDLCHPDGGFYAGEDADSYPRHDSVDKIEGAFYAWTWKDVKAAIEKNSELYTNITTDKAFDVYADYYSMNPNGNVPVSSDPQGHLLGKNIFIITMEKEAVLRKHSITEEQLELVIGTTNKILHEIRDQRPRPHLDRKIISAWNGLVLSGLSKLANCGTPKRDKYIEAAKKLVDFVRKNLYNAEKRELLRSCYGVDVADEAAANIAPGTIDGFLDDYSFMTRGLLDYYKASLDGHALKMAKELQDKQDELFWDPVDSAYFYSQENAPNMVLRLKEDHDGAEPCGNSVSARNLLLLGHYFDEENYHIRAKSLFSFYSGTQQFGHTLPEMMSALLLHEYGLDLVAVVGPDSETTQRFVGICRKFYIPGMIIVHVDPDQPHAVYSQRVQQKFKMINGKPTVYICHDKVCQMPVTDPDKLEENLMESFFKPRNEL